MNFSNKNGRGAYTRNSKKGKRGYRKNRRTQALTYSNMLRKVLADVRYVKSLVNPEFKYSDISIGSTNFGTGLGVLTLLNGLTQGTTGTTREGISIKLTDCDIKLNATIGTVAAIAFCRILVMFDKVPDGVNFVVGDLFQNAATGSDWTESHFNLGNTQRFRILFDKRFSLNTVSDTVNTFDLNFPMQVHSKYNMGNAGTIADINENALYLIMMSNQGTNFPTFTAQIRIRWLDN